MLTGAIVSIHDHLKIGLLGAPEQKGSGSYSALQKTTFSFEGITLTIFQVLGNSRFITSYWDGVINYSFPKIC